MRYCPKCQMLSQEADAEVCSACGEVLLSADKLSPEELDRLVVLTTCDNVYEARVLRAALGEEGIESMIEDEGLLEMVNPYHGRAAWNPRVMIRLADAEAALDLIRRKESGELAISEDDLTEEEPEQEDESPA